MLLVLAGTVSFLDARRMAGTLAGVNDAHGVLARLAGVSVNVERAVSAGRLFVLIGDDAVVASLGSIEREIAADLTALREALSGKPEQLSRLTALGELVRRRLMQNHEYIGIRSLSDLEESVDRIPAGGERLANEIRGLIGEIARVERARLEQLRTKAALDHASTITAMIATAVVSAAILFLGFWTLRGQIRSRAAAEDELNRSEASLKEAQRLAKVGNWAWDMTRDEHWWSDEMYRMLAIDRDGSQPPFERFLQRVHPDDLRKCELSLQRALTIGTPEPLDLRVSMPDGAEKTLHCLADIAFDADGRPVRMSGTLQDITERTHVEREIHRSEARLRAAQRLAKIGNWEWDVANHVEWWSDGLYSILDEDPETYGASFDNFLARVHPDDRQALRDGVGRMSSGAPLHDSTELRLVLRDGVEKAVHMRIEVRIDDNRRPLAVLGSIHDITERKQAEEALRRSEERYAATFELAAIGIAHIAPDGRFVQVNRQLCEMLGYEREELLALTVKAISHPEDIDVTDGQRASLHSGEIDSLGVEKRYRRKNGSTIWVRITSTVRRDADGKPLYDISIVEDISDRKRAEARVRYLASHDEMTGLPNRMMFGELLGHAVDAARRNRHSCAVMFIDLDGFKGINDSLGHKAGDEFLKVISDRLQRELREADVAARLGGDEFCVLLEKVPDAYSAAVVANKCLKVIAEPVVITGRELQPRASIGIALFPDDGEDHSTLLQNADTAMYAAKQAGSHRYAFYTRTLTIDAERRMSLEHDLRGSIQSGDFELHYQPQIALRDGRMPGVEALVRWRHPTRGLVAPGEFIEVAERIGLIEDLGEWVLRAACREAVSWNRACTSPIRVAVNISSRHLRDGRIVDSVAATLDETGLDPSLLEIEITESAIQTDDDVSDTFTRLRDLGVHIAIDDFGTGYSWLDSLRKLPIDTLKIDQRFVRDLTANTENSAIVATIFAMGRAMNLTVVAEGVETLEQVQYLHALGCGMAQGFYFSEAVLGAEVPVLAGRRFLPDLGAEHVVRLTAADA